MNNIPTTEYTAQKFAVAFRSTIFDSVLYEYVKLVDGGAVASLIEGWDNERGEIVGRSFSLSLVVRSL